MMFWIIFFAVLAVLAAGYFFSILPATSRRQECLKFAEWNYAHRGLWNAAEGVPENSLPAFARAAEQEAGAPPPQPALSEADWADLKNICGED